MTGFVTGGEGSEDVLTPATHGAVDHTSAPLNLLNTASHEGIDHTAAPLNLLDILAHEGIDHTASPLSLLDDAAHDAINHTASPFNLLNTAIHAAINHASIPGAGCKTNYHTGSWAGTSGAYSTGSLGFTPQAAIFIFAGYLTANTATHSGISIGIAKSTSQRGSVSYTGGPGNSNRGETVVSTTTVGGIGTATDPPSFGSYDASFSLSEMSSSNITVTPSAAITGTIIILSIGS